MRVESTGRPELTATVPAVLVLLNEAVKATVKHSAIYDLAYLLTAEEVA
ncbi:hypothetical protein [Bradyrhizobium cenepequi]|nr:hypothetical protein [Bradyrhizobium cenepequi]MCA6111540.1 hypothetical protein [Bradyrhizobium cenepequi]